MMNEVVFPPTEPLRRGELHTAEIVCDYAGQFRPGCWIFFGPGHLTNTKCPANLKVYWNRKTMEILDIYSESCHLAIPGTTIFEQGNLRQNRKEKTLSTSRAVTTCACASPLSSARTGSQTIPDSHNSCMFGPKNLWTVMKTLTDKDTTSM